MNAYYALLFLIIFLSFFRLDQQPIHQWDEARTGVNAVEMLENGDYINLHFGGEPDKIRAKPPLVIWWVAFNFKVFGKNTWSLRLHSAIATIFIFFFLYQIVRLYQPQYFAIACCLIMLSVRAVIGFHVGRTGDFDAVLLAFLLAGLYFFLLYFDFEQPRALYLAALFWGLAFLTKGPAMAVLWPGLGLYIVLQKRLKELLLDRRLYLPILLFLLFPIGWYMTIHFLGIQLDKPEVSGKNAFERMFLYDLLDRFTAPEFEGKTEVRDPLFLIKYLQENFLIWNYLLYLTILLGVGHWVSRGAKWSTLLHNKLLLLSISIWMTLSLFLSMVTTAKFWYLAPAAPFMAVTVVFAFDALYKKWKWIPLVFLGIWVGAMYMRYLGPKPQATPGSETPDFFTDLTTEYQDQIQRADVIAVADSLPAQRVLLQLHFDNPNVSYSNDDAVLNGTSSGDLLFLRKSFFEAHQQKFTTYSLLAKDQNYAILEMNE